MVRWSFASFRELATRLKAANEKHNETIGAASYDGMMRLSGASTVSFCRSIVE